MNIDQTPKMRSIVWMGNARKNIMAFPEEVRKLIEDELQFIQFGGMPKDAKIFKGVGSGVIEIALKYYKEAYRCVQAVQIYILHAFQKKAKKGISTPKQDVDLIKQRYREAKELKNHDKTNKH